ncbi:MAG: IS110 family transposase [Bacillota bacterium]
MVGSIFGRNPSYTKTFPGNKTDRRDAKWLAELHRLGLVLPSFIPSKHIRELRDLTRYRHKLVRLRSSVKARIVSGGTHTVLQKISPISVDCQVKLTPFLNYTPKGGHFLVKSSEISLFF